MRICFVTPEFAPFTPGGIGRLIANLVAAHAADDDIHVLIADEEVEPQALPGASGSARLWRMADWAQGPQDRPPLTRWQRASLRALSALKRLGEAHGPFDWIEFPDYGGLAHATLQERLMGRAFGATGIAVRLHGTFGILRPHQTRPPWADWPWLIDQERKCLREADVVVAHLASIAAANRAHYGFADDFLKRVRIETPPPEPGAATAPRTIAFGPDTPIAFTTKLQEIKRPETFITGALGFLRARPHYRGEIVFCAAAIEPDITARVRALVPDDLSDRIRFDLNPQTERRCELIARGVVVIPSAYESYCLAAYEASSAGAILLLNGANPAFGATTPWIAGRTCHLFDGSSRDLARQLTALWDARAALSLAPVTVSATNRPYWRRERPPAPPPACPPLSLTTATNDLDIDRVASDLVLVVGPNDRADPAFIEAACRALARHADYAAVVAAGSDGARAPLGEAPASGLFENALGGPTYVVRAETIRAHGFDERLAHLRDWDFLLRVALGGGRIIAAPGIGFDGGAPRAVDSETMARERWLTRAKHVLRFPGGAVDLSVIADGMAGEIAPRERALARARRRPLRNLARAWCDQLKAAFTNRAE